MQREALMGSAAQMVNRQRVQEETTILDMGVREEERLDAASQSVDQYITMGRNALQELYEQRDILKSTQRKMLDAANKLGLSTTVIRFIEQRSMSDRYILWGGIFISLVIMYLVV
ncbi:Golgi SNAP receptor complex member 2, partial [Kappamyces sp. JEL0680]